MEIHSYLIFSSMCFASYVYIYLQKQCCIFKKLILETGYKEENVKPK